MGFEGSLQSSILNYLNAIPGCTAENVSGNSSQSGRPDINGCYRGRAFKFELKVPDNRNTATKKQSLHLRRWKNSGCVVGVVYGKRILKKLFELDWDSFTGCITQKELNGCESWVYIPDRKGISHG